MEKRLAFDSDGDSDSDSDSAVALGDTRRSKMAQRKLSSHFFNEKDVPLIEGLWLKLY